MTREPGAVAALSLGVAGLLVLGLQPQLLGALALEGRVSEALLGVTASAEMLAMGITAGASGAWLARGNLRTTASAALLAASALDLATPSLRGGAVLAVRGLAGGAEGVLVAVAIGAIVRSASPARWSGAFLAVQTLAQFLVATLLGLVVLPGGGALGAFGALAAVSLVGLLALPFLPNRLAPLAAAGASAEPIGVRAWIALTGVTLYLAFIVATWVYVEPVGLSGGVPAATLAVVAPVSLALQILGASTATLIAERVPPIATLLIAGVANLLVLALMAAPPSPGSFVAAAGVFGFLWLFALPFQVPIVIAADPSRRAASLIGGAQLVGSGIGPLAVAPFVGPGQLTVVPVIAGGCLVAALACFVAARASNPTG